MVTEFGRSAYGEPIVCEDEYFERPRQIEALAGFLGRASRGQIGSGLIEGLRGVGKTDLIQRAIPRHLREEPSATLIYYQIQPYTLELFDLTRSYFNTFIRQYRYSRHHDDVDLQECVDLWHSRAAQCQNCPEPVLREICEAMGRAFLQRDATNALSLLVNMPHYLAELQGQRCVIVFDQARYLWQVHHRGQTVPLLRHLTANLESSVAPLFLGDSPVALRTLLGEQAASDRLAVFEVPRLDQHEAMAMLQTLCERLGVELSIRLADTIAPQLGGLPLYLHCLVRRAQLTGLALDSTERFGQVYAHEIRDGTIHWYWRAQFSTQFPRSVDRQQAAELCSYLAGFYPQRINLARLSQRLSLNPPQLQETITRLQLMGVLDRSFGTVGLVDDPVLRDVVTVLAWGESSATSDSELLRRLAARRVRGASTPPVEESIAEFLGRLERLLESFRGQYLPTEWFRYDEDYGAGWVGREGIRRWLGTSDTMLRLPYLVAVSRMDLEPATDEQAPVRPILLCGSGFRDKHLTPGNEIQWVTAIWPMTDPVSAEHVRQTMRLRNAVKQRTGREVRYTWLVGKATFTREARQLCSRLQILSGNMDMVDYIYDQMFAQGSPWRSASAPPSTAPEMVVVDSENEQAGEDSVELCLAAGSYPERVATETLEEVARAAGFSLARIGQMKMAVLEAVINAAETSADPSDKIRVRYVVLHDRLEVFVRSPGRHLSPQTDDDDQPADAEPREPSSPPRPLKGWGLRMIYTLADEVTIRPVENGTEIQLICKRESAG